MALPALGDEAGFRVLDAACESPSSAASARTVVQLGKLPLAERKKFLLSAVFWDLGNVVRCCLQELSPDTRFPEALNSTALYGATAMGNSRALKALLVGGANHALADEEGVTPLDAAASAGHLSCLRLLLEAGADAKKASADGHSTPLLETVRLGHVACVRELLPVSDLLHANRAGCVALHVAVSTADEECFELLLPLMDDVDVRSQPGLHGDGKALKVFQQTALHLACAKGQMAMARALLKRGADRMARDNRQRTPLHYAALAGTLSCLVLLVGRPEKPRLSPEQVSACDVLGFCALDFAADSGREKVCGVLVAAGARLDAKGEDGITPLQHAQAKHPGKASLHELLAGRGPANLPGTVCDHCAKPAGRKMVVCSACQIVRYCDAACQLAAWEGHEAECKAESARRDTWTRVVFE